MTLNELKAKRKNLIREYNKADLQAKKLSQAFTAALNKPDITGAAFREIETASKEAFKHKAKIDGDLLKIENEILKMRSKKNPTIIKAKKISHIDVSKTHNPAKLSAADMAKIEKARGLVQALGYKRPVDIRAAWQDTLFTAGMRGQKLLAAVQVATKKRGKNPLNDGPFGVFVHKPDGKYLSTEVVKIYKSESAAKKFARKFGFDKNYVVRPMGYCRDLPYSSNPARRRNLDHKDADHPIDVSQHWRSGPPGYMSPWQRAAAFGQNELFSTGIQLSKRAQEVRARRGNPALKWVSAGGGYYYAQTADYKFLLSPSPFGSRGKLFELKYDLKDGAGLKHWPEHEPLKEIKKIAAQIYKDYLSKQKATKNPGVTKAAYRSGLKEAPASQLIKLVRIGLRTGNTAATVAADLKKTGRFTAAQISRAIEQGREAEQKAKQNPARGTRSLGGSRELSKSAKSFRVARRQILEARESGNDAALMAPFKKQYERFSGAVSRHDTRKPKTRKANGAASAVKQIFEKFGGKVSTKTKTVSMPDGTPAHVAKLGTLRLIKLKNGPRYEFKGAAAPFLAADHRGKLHVVGGRYRANPPGQTLGEIETIEYETTKPHLGQNDETIYFHHLGEETGERPVMRIDADGLIKIVGGAYTIEADGIHN